MKALITKKSIKNIVTANNKFGITKDDLTGSIGGFPLSIVVRMLEETELQGNEPNIKIFQNTRIRNKEHGGFKWNETDDGFDFWSIILNGRAFDEFYKKYPHYKKYDK